MGTLVERVDNFVLVSFKLKKHLTSQISDIEYAQRVKVEAAKRAFENSRKSINEIMYVVSYWNVKAFREVFQGCRP